MRIDRVAVKAVVVLAMALLGWFSPTSAEAMTGCNEWFCADVLGACWEASAEAMEDACDIACPDWDILYCDDDNDCEDLEVHLYCQQLY